LVILGVEIWLINKGGNYFKNKVMGLKSSLLKYQSFELVSRSKQQLVVIGLINVVRIITILLIIYFSFLLMLSLFPGTSELVIKLRDYIFIPLKGSFLSVVHYLPRMFNILIIVIIFRYLFRLVKTLAIEIEKETIHIPTFEPRRAKTTAKIVNFIFLAIMLILILPLMPGYESLAFKGIAAFLAALITIGGSSVIANFMSGIVVSFMNPCQLGDWIQIDNTSGEVIEMSQFAIKIRTAENIIVSIPYTKSLSAHIINYSGDQDNNSILLRTTVSIGYDVSWEKVNELLLAAASITDNIDQSVPAFVRQKKLDDFYIVYELNVYTTDVRQKYQTYSELHKHILDTFKRAGIEILSPHYRVEK